MDVDLFEVGEVEPHDLAVQLVLQLLQGPWSHVLLVASAPVDVLDPSHCVCSRESAVFRVQVSIGPGLGCDTRSFGRFLGYLILLLFLLVFFGTFA